MTTMETYKEMEITLWIYILKLPFLCMLMNTRHNVNFIKNYVIKFVHLKLKKKCHVFSNKKVSMHFLNEKVHQYTFRIKYYVVQFR